MAFYMKPISSLQNKQNSYFKAKCRILNINTAIYATKKPDSIVSDLFYYYGGDAGSRTLVSN